MIVMVGNGALVWTFPRRWFVFTRIGCDLPCPIARQSKLDETSLRYIILDHEAGYLELICRAA
jgi:hypothetical protein